MQRAERPAGGAGQSADSAPRDGARGDASGGAPLKLLRNPIHYSETPIETYAAPPPRRQDTDAVLGALGYGADAIAALRAAKTI